MSTSLRDSLILDAKNLPDLVDRAKVYDPDLYDALTSQSATLSASPLGGFVAAGLTWAVTHYALGWSASFTNTLAGLAILAGGYGVHWIEGQLRPAPVSPKDPVVPPAAPITVINTTPTTKP